MQLSDGPFAEIKEQLGGYYILDCADLDPALRYTATPSGDDQLALLSRAAIRRADMSV